MLPGGQLTPPHNVRKPNNQNSRASSGDSDAMLPIVMLTNANRLHNKIDELYCLVNTERFDVICITETWLSPEVPDSVYQMPDFLIFRRDRLDRMGGGVMFYVRPCLNPRSIVPCVASANEFELLWILLRPARLPRPLSVIIVAVLYCPPWYDRQTKKQLTEHIISCIDALNRRYDHPGFLFTGDFNSLDTGFFEADCTLGNLLKSIQELIKFLTTFLRIFTSSILMQK